MSFTASAPAKHTQQQTTFTPCQPRFTSTRFFSCSAVLESNAATGGMSTHKFSTNKYYMYIYISAMIKDSYNRSFETAYGLLSVCTNPTTLKDRKAPIFQILFSSTACCVEFNEDRSYCQWQEDSRGSVDFSDVLVMHKFEG